MNHVNDYQIYDSIVKKQKAIIIMISTDVA